MNSKVNMKLTKLTKSFRTEVSSEHDYSEVPTIVEFSIDRATAMEIVRLAELVRKNGLYKVEKPHYGASYLQHDPDEPVGTPASTEEDNVVLTDGDRLNVSDTDFWCSAYIKHTNVLIMGEQQSVAELAKCFGIAPTDK